MMVGPHRVVYLREQLRQDVRIGEPTDVAVIEVDLVGPAARNNGQSLESIPVA